MTTTFICFLQGDCPGTSFTIGSTSSMYWSPVTQNDITWNFEKFLVGKDGLPYKRYGPAKNPKNIYDDIVALSRKVKTKDTKPAVRPVKQRNNTPKKPLTSGVHLSKDLS